MCCVGFQGGGGEEDEGGEDGREGIAPPFLLLSLLFPRRGEWEG